MENIHFIFEIINILVYALAFILWQRLKAIDEKSEKTKTDLAIFKTHVAERYSQKKDIEEMERRINEQLTTLSNRMEQGLQMIYQQLLKGKEK